MKDRSPSPESAITISSSDIFRWRLKLSALPSIFSEPYTYCWSIHSRYRSMRKMMRKRRRDDHAGVKATNVGEGKDCYHAWITTVYSSSPISH